MIANRRDTRAASVKAIDVAAFLPHHLRGTLHWSRTRCPLVVPRDTDKTSGFASKGGREHNQSFEISAAAGSFSSEKVLVRRSQQPIQERLCGEK